MNNTPTRNPKVRTSEMKPIQGGEVGTSTTPQEGKKKNRKGMNGVVGEDVTGNWKKVKINICIQGKNGVQSGPTEHTHSPMWKIDRGGEKSATSNKRPITKKNGPNPRTLEKRRNAIYVGRHNYVYAGNAIRT